MPALLHIEKQIEKLRQEISSGEAYMQSAKTELAYLLAERAKLVEERLRNSVENPELKDK